MKRFPFTAILIALLSSLSLSATETPPVKVGEKAPDFTLTSAEEKTVSLSDFAEKDIVLIFSRAHW